MITHNPADLGVLGAMLFGETSHINVYIRAIFSKRSQKIADLSKQKYGVSWLCLGVRNSLRLIRDRLLFHGHKGQPNLLIDCQ